ncbi:hypothetical protein NOF04DRAFT_1362870, partial [Fusarium oxysporum II5]
MTPREGSSSCYPVPLCLLLLLGNLAVAQKCAASLNIDGYTQPAQCAAFRVQDSLIVSNKEHQSSSEDATQNTFSRFANVEAQDFANFSVHLADSALLRFEDEALIASLRNETLHRCRYHSHNELPHEQFMCRQHIKLSDSPKILNLPNFS